MTAGMVDTTVVIAILWTAISGVLALSLRPGAPRLGSLRHGSLRRHMPGHRQLAASRRRRR